MKFSENNYFRKRATRTNLVAVVTVAFVLFILGLVGFLALRGQALTNYIKENIEIQVFLKESASQAEIDAFTSGVGNNNMVNKWRFVSKKEAAEILSKDLGTNQLEILEGYNPLQASVNISLKSIYAKKDSVDKFKAMLQSKAIVDEVAFNEIELELINKNLKRITTYILAFCLLLLVVSLVVINNAIKLSLYAKRFNIKSMQLVGATSWFIQKPFVLKGMLNGIYSALIASAMLYALIFFIEKKLPELTVLQNNNEFLTIVILMIALGIILSLFSTFVSVKRYLNSSVEELY